MSAKVLTCEAWPTYRNGVVENAVFGGRLTKVTVPVPSLFEKGWAWKVSKVTKTAVFQKKTDSGG